MRAARFLLLTAVLVACAFADESAPGLTPDFNAEDPAANAHPLPYSKEQLHKLPNSVLHRMLHDRGVICKDCGDKSQIVEKLWHHREAQVTARKSRVHPPRVVERASPEEIRSTLKLEKHERMLNHMASRGLPTNKLSPEGEAALSDLMDQVKAGVPVEDLIPSKRVDRSAEEVRAKHAKELRRQREARRAASSASSGAEGL